MDVRKKIQTKLQSYAVRRMAYMKRHRSKVYNILTEQFHMEQNIIEKVIKSFFSEGFLPSWYFYHNTEEEIAKHIFVFTQLLNANTEFIKLESSDGMAMTYLVNVGWDFVGKLARIVKECSSIDILRYDSVMSRSGVRIITIEKACRIGFPTTAEKNREIDFLKDKIISFGTKSRNPFTDLFLQGIPCNYFTEEINTFTRPRRVYRHFIIFQKAMGRVIVRTENVPLGADEDSLHGAREKRITIAVSNPDQLFPHNVLKLISEHNIRLLRSYFDKFANAEGKTSVAIFSAYVSPSVNTKPLVASLRRMKVISKPEEKKGAIQLEKKLERILRCLSSDHSGKIETAFAMDELIDLIKQNNNIENSFEMGDVLLNIFTDFFKALCFLKLHKAQKVIRLLVNFDAFDEFFILSKIKGETINLPGFRAKHNSARGPNKGGIRLDPIVRFTGVAALSFMMTWKCARTRILFGGGKGGLVINPKEYSRLELFDTLSNFGRSLFLITGPGKDIPAGDVGCGPEEIGEMFEGFKSTLRDLALMAHGIKKGVSIVGNRIISTDRARYILQTILM